MNKKPHVHAELIKAWADGAEIQFRRGIHWYDVQPIGCQPLWGESTEYRIKPEEKPKKTVRLALCQDEYGRFVACSHDAQDEQKLLNRSVFVRWLTDTIEYEAE